MPSIDEALYDEHISWAFFSANPSNATAVVQHKQAIVHTSPSVGMQHAETQRISFDQSCNMRRKAQGDTLTGLT